MFPATELPDAGYARVTQLRHRFFCGVRGEGVHLGRRCEAQVGPGQSPVDGVQPGELGVENRGFEPVGADLVGRTSAVFVIGVIQGPHGSAP